MITSAANEGLKNLKKLMNSTGARKKAGLYTVEGIKLFMEAPGDIIERVYISEALDTSAAGDLREKLSALNCLTVRQDIFDRLTDTRTPQGIVTLMRRPVCEENALLKENENSFLIVLETIQDPGNLGTIIRTAEAAGATGVLLDEACADPFGPKAVRASAGSIFRMPVAMSRDILGSTNELKSQGYSTFAAHLKGDRPHTDFDYTGSIAFLIGNEGRGLSDELAAMADNYIRIPMEGGVESLNASMAAAIMMYEAHRQRHRG